MGLPPTVSQKIKNLLSKFHKQCLSFMLTKTYGNVCSNNEVILAVRFLNLANIFCIKDGHSPSQFMFDANHFYIEATLETTDSDKLSKHSS